MKQGARATISCSATIVVTAMLIVCAPGAVLGAEATLQSTEPSARTDVKAVRTTDTANQPQPTLPSTFEQEVVEALLSKLNSEPKLSKELAKSELEALQKFYVAMGRNPLWVNQKGMNTNAHAIVAEFRSAGDHGLRPSDYTKLIDDSGSRTAGSLAKLELDLSVTALAYARHAKAGRTSPNLVGLQLTYTPAISDPLHFLKELASTADPSAYLRSLHPQHPQFLRLREKLREVRSQKTSGSSPKLPDGPVLKKGISHAHVALLRKRLGISPMAEDLSGGEAKRFDAVLEETVKEFQGQNGLTADGVVGAGTRRVLNGRSPDQLTTKILMNMERWRWLPDELGGKAGIYVWANIPELRVRAIEGNETVFSEKAIVGQVSHKTPVFSDQIEWIDLHPTWFVPNSIKVSDILPSLRRPTSTVMERYNLKANCGKYGSDYKAIDWHTIDIRQCSFSQPPGKTSVLGDFKFKFPNKHSVYMHDTHDRSLFKQKQRTFSHGCIRVQRPRRLAEILLKHDKGMSAERIGEIVDGPKQLHKETLNQPIPVHITYFTLLFDDQGKFSSSPDYYGHDKRLAAVLAGKSYNLAKADARKRRAPGKKRTSKKPTSWWDGFFPAN
jgi:murein L,D-transpeptidase YcbB/YkuD